MNGDYFSMEDWIDIVDSGGFIDYDGFGYLCTVENVPDKPIIVIKPSDIDDADFRDELVDYAGVMWFNR